MTQQRQQMEYQDTINKLNQMYGLNQNQNQNQNLVASYQNKVNEMSVIIQEISLENKLLKDKVKYLEDKIRQIIIDQIEKNKNNIKL
jgi:hypothetical protein